MTKLTKEEFDAILDILVRICEENNMCQHEAMIWLQIEIYHIIKFAEKQHKEQNN